MKKPKLFFLNFFQILIFKTSLIFIGIAVGAYWSDFLLPYLPYFVMVGLIFGIYIFYVWFKGPNERKSLLLMYF